MDPYKKSDRNPDKALDLGKNLVSDLIARHRQRVDYLAIRLERSEGCQVRLRGDVTEALSEGLAIGGQVRVCHKG
ncbi:MAG: hypothetical protein ABG776_06230, partial [Cyanobacteria bacterium J06555_13]